MGFSISIKAIVILHVVIVSVAQYMPYYPPPMARSMSGPVAPMGAPIMAPMPGLPQQRMPVMVMPYHSKAADRKYMKKRKRRPKKYYRESDYSSDSCSSSDEYLRNRSHGRKKKRQVLTPVISYVTRNGRVVYQKRIKKENAGDWLEMGSKRIPSKLIDGKSSGEMTADIKRRYGRNSHYHHDEDY